MKKLLIGLIFILSALVYADKNDMDRKPCDVDTVLLHDATASSSDTFTAGECAVYGPYSFTQSNKQPSYKGFYVYGKAITGTTPTMTLGYQLIPNITGTLADTTGLWIEADTLDGTGANKYVDLSSAAGQGIVFRINNYDGTDCQIPSWVVIMLKENYNYNIAK